MADLDSSQSTENEWSLSGNVATIKDVPDLVVTGVNSTDGLSLSGNVVTVSKSSGNTISVSDGYTLQVTDDLKSQQSQAARFTYSGGTATYISAYTTRGYTFSDNNKTITYTSGGNGAGDVEIEGVKSSQGIDVQYDAEGKWVITLSEQALNKQQVRIDNPNYTLKLAEGVASPVSTPAGWTLQGTKATYNEASQTEGYEVVDSDTIEYKAEEPVETVVEVNGVTNVSNDAIILNKQEKEVAVYAAALSPQNVVTISEGYTLTLGDEDDASSTNTQWSRLNNGNMAYKADETSAGYKVEDNQIKYVAASEGHTVAELSGVAASSTPVMLDSEGIMQLEAGNFESDIAVVSTEYNNFKLLDGQYADRAFTASKAADLIENAGNNVQIKADAGNDNIENNGSEVTINGGAGADRVSINASDSVSSESNNVFAYATGDGNDVVYNFNTSDKIQLLDTEDYQYNVKNNDVVFKVGNGQITLKDAAKRETKITVVGADEDNILSDYTYTKEGITRGYTIELAQTFKGHYIQGDNISIIDGRKVRDGAWMEGLDNSAGGAIVGGDGKDTLISSENDFSLVGGAGNDLFVFGGGKDTIDDYRQRADRISLASALKEEVESYDFDGANLVIRYGDENSLTIVNGVGKEITFADRKSTVKIYTEDGVSENKKSIILSAEKSGTFNAAGQKSLVTINGSAVLNEIELTGNNKANYIVAGEGNTTLNGNKGKDTLVGSDLGADTFVYNKKSGNKVIRNYGQGDIISLVGSQIDEITTKGNNAILKVGKNTITVEGMANNSFTFSEDGDTKTYNNGRLEANGSVTLSPAISSEEFKGVFDLAAYPQYKNVSASLTKKSVELIGDDDDNELIGGKAKDTLRGGANNDTLNGGKGNDILWGGDAADTFVYRVGEGTDTIMDYSSEDGDLLQIIDKNDRAVSRPIKKQTFEGNDLILSIRGGGKLILAGVGTSAVIKANDSTYSYSK